MQPKGPCISADIGSEEVKTGNKVIAKNYSKFLQKVISKFPSELRRWFIFEMPVKTNPRMHDTSDISFGAQLPWQGCQWRA